MRRPSRHTAQPKAYITEAETILKRVVCDAKLSPQTMREMASLMREAGEQFEKAADLAEKSDAERTTTE